MKWIDFNLRHANYALHVLHEHNRTLSKITEILKRQSCRIGRESQKGVITNISVQQFKCFHVENKQKGCFSKRLSFKYSQSLKSETRLITVAKYCIQGISYLIVFCYIHTTHPQKKSLRRERGLKVLTDCLCVDECCLICLQLLSKTKSHSCDPVGRRQVFEASGTAVRSESAAGGCVNSGVRSRLALIIHTGRVQQGIPRTVPKTDSKHSKQLQVSGTDTVCRTWWTSTLSDIWLFESYSITKMVVLPVFNSKI